MTEAQLQKSICDYLQYLENQGKLVYCRTSVGAIKTDTGRYFKTGKKGWPDITVLCNGQFLGIEVKSMRGKVSDEQYQMGALINQLGGFYVIARSLQIVADHIAEILNGTMSN